MGKSKKKAKAPSNNIATNKSAWHEYFLEEKYEAGISLQGWEVKSLREGRINLKESYVFIKQGEAFISGAHISPLQSASTHVDPNPTRIRKLLLHRRELNELIGAVERKGYTLLPISMYWQRGKAKLEVALGKGKKQHDKRESEKKRDWNREKGRIMKETNR